MTEVTQEYFDNKRERAEIELALLRAIPENTNYSNLIIVFAEMLTQFARTAFNELGTEENEDE